MQQLVQLAEEELRAFPAPPAPLRPGISNQTNTDPNVQRQSALQLNSFEQQSHQV